MPADPATTEQVPLAKDPSAAEQTSQLPEHGESQQKPFAHDADRHSAEAAQLCPFVLGNTQTLPRHTVPATQCELLVQLVGQAAPNPRQRYGVHEGIPGPEFWVQVPLAVAPRDSAHTLQEPTQDELQQNPSTQLFEKH